MHSLVSRTFGRVPWAAEPQVRVSAVGPFLYTVSPMVSWVPGKSRSGPSGALSFSALETKSFGSSGGGALVGAKDGRVAVALGMSAVEGSCEEGLSEAWPEPFAETTATATAPAIATVASAPPPMNSSRRRLARASEASARAAQSGVPSLFPLFHGCCDCCGCCCDCGVQGSHCD